MSIARQIVDFAIQAGSSDIHLEEGSPIAIRVNSDIKILENILGPEDMTQLMHELIGEEKLEDIGEQEILIHRLAWMDYQESVSMLMSPTKNVALRSASFQTIYRDGKI